MVNLGIGALSQELPSRAELIEQVADDTRVMPGIEIARIDSAKKNSNRDKHFRVGRNRGESCRMGPRQNDTEGAFAELATASRCCERKGWVLPRSDWIGDTLYIVDAAHAPQAAEAMLLVEMSSRSVSAPSAALSIDIGFSETTENSAVKTGVGVICLGTFSAPGGACQ